MALKPLSEFSNPPVKVTDVGPSLYSISPFGFIVKGLSCPGYTTDAIFRIFSTLSLASFLLQNINPGVPLCNEKASVNESPAITVFPSFVDTTTLMWPRV